MNETHTTAATTPAASRPRKLRGVVGAAIMAVAATVTLSAWSNSPMPGMGPAGQHMGHPGGPAELVFGGPRLFMGPGAENPERVGRMVDHMLDGLKATDAQRTQIKEIVRSAAADLKTLRDKDDARALREKSLEIFGARTIDAKAADAVRKQMEARRNEVDARVMQAMLDIARVLSPEQRAQVTQNLRYQADRREDAMKRMMARRDERGERGPMGGPDGYGGRHRAPAPDAAPPAPAASGALEAPPAAPVQ